jgi:thiamine-phosphate pyrophosphorylase
MAQRAKSPEPRPQPRLYLVTPALEDAAAFVAPLEAALAAGDVAAVLLRLADGDERSLINRIRGLASTVQKRDAALIIDGRAELVARSGADGAHLTGIEAFGEAVATLKPDRISGIGGLSSRHDAMVAAETGADYVMFGEPNDGERPAFDAIEERVAWWAEVFEAPCVGYAASLDEVAALTKAGADFVTLGDFVWREPQNIAAQVAAAAQRLTLPKTAA